MWNRKQVGLRVETIESLTLLSGAAASILAATVHVDVVNTTTAPLVGTVQGTLRDHKVPPAKNSDGTTTGGYTTHDIKASGKLTPIGAAKVTGSLTVDSGVSIDGPWGTLELTTSKGTLTLDVPYSVAIPTGLPKPTSQHQIVITYAISQGTGAYAGETGAGVVEFTFTAGRVNLKFPTLSKPITLT